MDTYARLLHVAEERAVTPEQDGPFLRRFCLAALLALKEEGILTEAQLRRAEAKLWEERRAAGKAGV
ncbi:MAG: hypothetical protein ACI3WR_08860 [Oscillospiraceae bacterium]